MAKRMRKSTKITIISVVVAVVAILTTVLTVLLTRNGNDFLTASQKEFFSALNAENVYSSNLSQNTVNFGEADYDSVVTVYDNYALIKIGNTYKLVSTKLGYAGMDTGLVFDGVLCVEDDIIVIRYQDNYFVYKLSYASSSVINQELLYGNVSGVKLAGDILALFYDADQKLVVKNINTNETLLEEENVIDYSVSEAGIGLTLIAINGDDVKSVTKAYVNQKGALKQIGEYEAAASVSVTETKYEVDGKFISLDNLYIVRVSGEYILAQYFEGADSDSYTCIIGGKEYKLTQTVKSIKTGKTKALSNNLYFDSVKSVAGKYIALIGNKIASNKEVDFDERTAYYYNNNFELIISYDYDKFGDLIDYKNGLLIAKKGFIDVLGNGKDSINAKLAENNINSIILSSADGKVFAKNASAVYLLDIAKSSVKMISTTATSFVDGYMLVEKNVGAEKSYALVNKNGDAKVLANISTDENLLAYSKLSTGYYFEKVDVDTVRLVNYSGNVIMDGVAIDSVSFSLNYDKSKVVIACENASGVKYFESLLPSGAILPNTIDSAIIYSAVYGLVADPVSVPTNRTDTIAESNMGTDYLSDNPSNPFFIKTSGANIEVVSYYKNLLTNITFNQYNRILEIVTDVESETTTAIADLYTDALNFNGLGVNYATITKLERSFYNAEVTYIQRARNVVYKVLNADSTTSNVSGQIWYNDVHSNSVNYVIPESFKTGYTFAGYEFEYGGTKYTVSDKTTLALDSTIVEVVMPTRSEGKDLEAVYTFTPKFVANNYTVTFNANSESFDNLTVSGNVANINATYDVAFTLPGEVYSSLGFKHIGFTTTEGGKTVEFDKNEEVINLATEDGDVVTLYAVWAYNQYNIIYDSNLATVGTNAIAYKANGREYVNRSSKKTLTITDTSFGSFETLYAWSEETGYMKLENFYANGVGTENFNILQFFDYVENDIVYDSEEVTSAANAGRVYNVYAYAKYESISASFAYNTVFETKTLAGTNIGTAYKAINTSSSGEYSLLMPINYYKCDFKENDGVNANVLSIANATLEGVSFGDSIEFALGVNNGAAYIKNAEIRYFVNKTEYVVKIVGNYNKTTGEVSYSVTEAGATVVTGAGSISVILDNVSPKFDFASGKCVLGSATAVVGLKEFTASVKFNGVAQTISYPNMNVGGENYSYSATLFYGREFNVMFDAGKDKILKNIVINGTSYDLTFEYTKDRNDLYISSLNESVVDSGSAYYRLYNIDGLNVKVGYNGTTFYAEVYGQILKNTAISATSETVSSNIVVSGVNKSGSNNAITISGIKQDVKPTQSSFKINYTLANGYRASSINVKYAGKTINSFRTFNYDNWNRETGVYNTYGVGSSDFIYQNKIANTAVSATGSGQITIAGIWFDLEIQIEYERVADIIINIDDNAYVSVLDQNDNSIIGRAGVISSFAGGVYKIRVLGNEDITSFKVQTYVGDIVYYIESVTTPTSMQAVTVTNKVSAEWDSYKTSYTEMKISKYAVTMAVTTYLGKGEGLYEKEHERVGGTYYLLDAIDFAFNRDNSDINVSYRDLSPVNSVASITFNGKTFVMNMSDTTGDVKGYLAAKYVLKDASGKVLSQASSNSLVFNLTNEMVGALTNAFTLDIYFDAIEYDVEYIAGDFSGIADDFGNTTNGTVASTHHVFNVDKSLSSDRFIRNGWTNYGWTYDDSALSRNGKAADRNIPSRNLANEDGATVTLYGAWKVNTYTIVYDDNISAGSSDVETDNDGTDTVDYLYNFADLKVVSRDGYIFKGWFVTGNIDHSQISNQMLGYDLYADLAAKNNLDESAKEIYVTAQWEKISYTLTADNFHFNDADENGSSTATLTTGSLDFTVTFETKFGTLPTLNRTGYNFVGWAPSVNGEVIIESGETVLNNDLFQLLTGTNKDKKDNTASFDLYAIWEKQEFNIIFNMNYGTLPGNTLTDDNGFSATPNTQTVKFDEAFGTLPTVSSNGYVFKGWHFYPTFDYTAVTGTPCTAATVLSMDNWDSIYATVDKMLASTYQNGAPATYSFTLFAYWEIKSYTVTANPSFTGGEYVARVSHGTPIADVKTATIGTAASSTMYYGDFAVIDLIAREGYFINKLTFAYNGKEYKYTINWNSSTRSVTITADSAFDKTNFVENIEIIESAYNGGKIDFRIVLTFVKTNISLAATETIQTYEVLFTDNVNNGTLLFTTLVEYGNQIDERLFVYPYRKGYKFAKYSLTNNNNETANDSAYIDKTIFFDTEITLEYIESATQKVNFYLWNGSSYALATDISSGYVLSSGSTSGNYTLDESLTPITSGSGRAIKVVMGGTGSAQFVYGFSYGGRILTLPSANADYYPAETYVAGYVIASSAPASGYYTENMTGSGANDIAGLTKYQSGYMIEEVINLYAVYNEPVFKFVSDDAINDVKEFSVAGYTSSQVKYAYVSSSDLARIQTIYAANKNLPAALQQVLSGGVTAGNIKIAYLEAVENGTVYIYRVASTYWNGVSAVNIY